MDLSKLNTLQGGCTKEHLAHLVELHKLIDEGKPLPEKFRIFKLVDKDTYRLKGRDGVWRTHKF